MNNLIDAIINIIKQPVMKLADYTDSHNRINSTGAALEEYIKDVFAGTLGEYNQQIRNHKIAETFSYLGNQNNPPDSMLRCGDAIEVKKIESKSSFLSLNSSYPKDKLFKIVP